LGVAARQTRLVIGGCTCQLAHDEEAMSTAEPLGEDRWPATAWTWRPVGVVATDLVHFTEILVGRVVFAIETMGTRVAAVQ
jgi:hypothetical protein